MKGVDYSQKKLKILGEKAIVLWDTIGTGY